MEQHANDETRQECRAVAKRPKVRIAMKTSGRRKSLLFVYEIFRREFVVSQHRARSGEGERAGEKAGEERERKGEITGTEDRMEERE